MSNWLDDFHQGTDCIRSSVYELEGLARAFYRTGNTKMGDEIEFIAGVLRDSEKTVTSAMSRSINESVQTAFEATDNMVKACIAVSLKDTA